MGPQKNINTPVRMQQMIRPLEWWLDNSETGGANFILRDGELGIAKVDGQPSIIKVGDGIHNWDSLLCDTNTEAIEELEKKIDTEVLSKVNKNTQSIGELNEKIADCASKKDIQELDKQIEAIKSATPEDAFIYDYEVAYTKKIPQNVAKYAELKEIGGNTVVNNYFDINLFVDQFLSSPDAVNVQQGTITSDSVSDIYTEDTFGEIFKNLIIGKEYVLEYTYDQDVGGIRCGDKNIRPGETFILDESIYSSKIVFNCYIEPEDAGAGIPHAVTYSNLYLYEKGKEMISAKVTEILIDGSNALPYPYPHAKNFTKNGVEVTYESDGSVTINGSSTGNVDIPFYKNSDNLSLPEEGVYIHPYDNIRFYVKRHQSDWSNYSEPGKGASFKPDPTDAFYNHYYVYFNFGAGITFNHVNLKPCLSRGMDYQPVETYLKPRTYPMPQQILDSDDYGISNLEANNFIHWTEDGKEIFNTRVKEIILTGHELWSRHSNENGCFYQINLTLLGLNAKASKKILSNKFNSGYPTDTKKPCAYISGSSDWFLILFPGEEWEFDSIDEWTALLKEWNNSGTPLRVIYSLETPIETDVSGYFEWDNLLEIRGGGNITMINENNMKIPSIICYQKRGN